MFKRFNFCGQLVGTVCRYGNKKPVSVPNEAAEESESEISTDADAEIVAAITAAISMMYAAESEDGEVPPFRVKSIILN